MPVLTSSSGRGSSLHHIALFSSAVTTQLHHYQDQQQYRQPAAAAAVVVEALSNQPWGACLWLREHLHLPAAQALQSTLKDALSEDERETQRRARLGRMVEATVAARDAALRRLRSPWNPRAQAAAPLAEPVRYRLALGHPGHPACLPACQH